MTAQPNVGFHVVMVDASVFGVRCSVLGLALGAWPWALAHVVCGGLALAWRWLLRLRLREALDREPRRIPEVDFNRSCATKRKFHPSPVSLTKPILLGAS